MTGRERALAALRGEPVDRVPRYADFRDPSRKGGRCSAEAQVVEAAVLQLDMTREPARAPELPCFKAVEAAGPAKAAAIVLERLAACEDAAGNDLLPIVEFPYSILGPALAGDDAMHKLATMASSPADAASFLEKGCRFCCALAAEFASSGKVAALLFMDDLAGSQGPFISPETLRALYFPRLREVLSILKAGKSKVIFHSDGDLRTIHRDIAAAGADGHHPVEPVGAWSLSEASASGTILIGNGSLGKILASEQSAAAEGRRCLRFGAGRSGYFIAPSAEIGPETPVANIVAFFTGTSRNVDFP